MNRLALRIGITFAALLIPLVTATWAGAATITVDTTSDVTAVDGSCTLREAITASNSDSSPGDCAAGAGTDQIEFSIPGSGPHVIAPATDLPHLTTPMSIDGSTDPHQIALNGAPSTGLVGIYVTGDDVAVNDLTIVGWSYGVWITNAADSTVVSDCRIGTNAAGAALLGNLNTAVDIRAGATNTLITGNVIASSGQKGVSVKDDDTTGTTLTGNYIGTNPAGTAALPNEIDGVVVNGAPDTTIGGPSPADGNLISGNKGRGVYLSNAFGGDMLEGTVIQNNLIGTDADGLAELGNTYIGLEIRGEVVGTTIEDNVVAGTGDGSPGSGVGVLLQDVGGDDFGPTDTVFRGNRIGVGLDGSAIANDSWGVLITPLNDLPITGTEIGGTAGITPGGPCTGDCNLIANNGGAGVYLDDETATGSILGNEIRDNDSLGIELTPFAGVTPNDPGDADTGANGLQNFPELRAVQTDGGQTGITGILDSTADTDFRIELFANETADPTGHGEAEVFVDAFEVTTDGSGAAGFTRLLDQPLAPGTSLSATATKLSGSGVPESTSEFSLNKGPTCDQTGNSGPNTLTANGSGQTLCGLGGDDVLEAADGGDILDGAAGTDTADYGASSESVVVILGEKTVLTSFGNDLLFGIENLTGSPFGDTLIGDSAANQLSGGNGSDSLVPGDGVDTVLGGDGDDLIVVGDGGPDALVNCGPGNDAVSADPVAQDPDSIFIDCETIFRPPVPDPPDPTCETDPSLCPDPPDPVVYKCDGKVATIVGTNSGENLVGTDKRDIIVARAGADKIYPKAGNDIVCAGDGNDVVKGREGNDLVFGQNGADKLYGQEAKDTLNGGDGYDYLYGSDSADVLKGGAKNDRLFGQNGDDILRGGDGADRLFGGNSSDTLKGEAGNKDLLYGQNGFDKLEGGNGKGDVCDGGSGKDRKSAPRCETRRRIP